MIDWKLKSSLLGCYFISEHVWLILAGLPNGQYVVAKYINGRSEWINGNYFSEFVDATKLFSDKIKQFC